MGSEQRSMTADEIRERECALLEAVVGLLGRIEEIQIQLEVMRQIRAGLPSDEAEMALELLPSRR